MYSQKEQKNRLLRRADWRYLLSNPWPEKSVCYSGGLLAKAVQAVSSHFIPTDRVTAGECDLVVATNPDSASLKKSFLALQSGGSFYSEWYLPIVGGTKEIRKRLEATGFTDVVCYWPWPIPALSSPLFWLPIDAPHAVDFFLSKQTRPEGMQSRIGSKLLQIMWKFSWKTQLLVPICVTACKPDQTAINTFTASPIEEVAAQKRNGKLGSKNHRSETLMWTGGKSPINKVILYQFTANEDEPHQIIKFPRLPESVPAITHEARILQALHVSKNEAAKHAPTALFLHEVKGMAILGETTVVGRPLYSVLNKKNTIDWAIKVTDWLTSLAVGGSIIPRQAYWNRLVEPALRDFEGAFGQVLDELRITQCREILSHLGDLPQAFEHRDCSPWNLLVTKNGELAVLDWESAEQDGLPILDLVYFLTYLAFFIDGSMKTGDFIAAYQRASNPATFTGQIQATCQQRYMERINLDAAALHPLRLLTWLIHSRSEIRQMTTDSNGRLQPDVLRNSLFYKLVLEEVRREYIPEKVSLP